MHAQQGDRTPGAGGKLFLPVALCVVGVAARLLQNDPRCSQGRTWRAVRCRRHSVTASDVEPVCHRRREN